MDINIKILGTERTDDGKNRFVVRINDKETLSFLLQDNEIINVNTLKNALTTQLKSKIYVGSEFIIVV